MRNSNSRGRFWLAISGIVVVLGVAAFLNRSFVNRRGAADPSPAPPSGSRVTGEGNATSNTRKGGALASFTKIPVRKKPSLAEVESLWRGFQSSYGVSLRAAFTDDHRVASIRSGDEPGTPAPGFQSGDRDAAVARAQEILDHATDLIGLNRDFPLKTSSVQSDDVASQVEWIQTFGGVPIEPYGRVTLQLDAQGGLRGLYSNYISDPVIGNEASLNADQARQAAVSSLGDQLEHPEQNASGQLILFAAGPQSGESSVPLRYAYRFSIEGRQVIVDAASGKILKERDEREF